VPSAKRGGERILCLGKELGSTILKVEFYGEEGETFNDPWQSLKA
jgi:hypothetical protein